MLSKCVRSAKVTLWALKVEGYGGIQSYMWRLNEMLSMLDKSGVIDAVPRIFFHDDIKNFREKEINIMKNIQCCSGSKLLFSRLLLRGDFKGSTVIVGHIHLAIIAFIAKCLGLIDRYVVILHGIEAWRRLSFKQFIGCRWADQVIATTHFTIDQLKKHNKNLRCNFAVIPLCYEPNPADADTSFKLDGEFPILFVARLVKSESYKGLDTIIKATSLLIKKNIPIKLHVIGDGDARVDLEYFAKSQYLLGPEQIHFYGLVDQATLQAAYSSAKVFVMPSEKEGFGIVFLEAMRHGVPCIGGNHGGTPEIFKNGGGGLLVRFDDVGAIATHIEKFFTDPYYAKNIGEAGNDNFIQNYTFETFFKKWKSELVDLHV